MVNRAQLICSPPWWLRFAQQWCPPGPGTVPRTAARSAAQQSSHLVIGAHVSGNCNGAPA